MDDRCLDSVGSVNASQEGKATSIDNARRKDARGLGGCVKFIAETKIYKVAGSMGLGAIRRSMVVVLAYKQ